MKVLIYLGVFAFLNFMPEARAADSALICYSSSEVQGSVEGQPTRGVLLYTAYVFSNTELGSAQVRGPYHSKTWTIYAERSSPHLDQNQFEALSDGQCHFILMAPSELTYRSDLFNATVQIQCEPNENPIEVPMTCFLRH